MLWLAKLNRQCRAVAKLMKEFVRSNERGQQLNKHVRLESEEEKSPRELDATEGGDLNTRLRAKDETIVVPRTYAWAITEGWEKQVTFITWLQTAAELQTKIWSSQNYRVRPALDLWCRETISHWRTCECISLCCGLDAVCECWLWEELVRFWLSETKPYMSDMLFVTLHWE